MTWYNICTYLEEDFRMAKQHDKQFKMILSTNIDNIKTTKPPQSGMPLMARKRTAKLL